MRSPRRLLLALVPVLLLLLLTAGLRFASRSGSGGAESAPTDEVRGERRPAPARRRRSPPAAPPETAGADPATQKALEDVVAGQIDCFGREDYAGALEFAEPRFRASWSPEDFRTMVVGAYRPLTRGYRATFGRGRVTASSATLPVTLASGDGEKVLYAYFLARVEGRWYVAGVAPTGPAPGSPDVPPGAARPGTPGAGDVREL